MLELGFDTMGNASIICYDKHPVLVTDPWVTPNAYFGSWTHSHQIPEEQLAAIQACEYVWFSHSHPDHLNTESLPLFKNKKILLPDHVGGRVCQDLKAEGFQVHVMKDKEWMELSPRVKVLCITDYNQDAVLLIDINGKLLVNTNDANAVRGWAPTVKKIAKKYPQSFLLALSGFGDADMINLYDETGCYILPSAAKRNPVGLGIAKKLEFFGIRFFIPSSSFHRYQRKDSIWANQYATTIADYPVGFESTTGELLPPFVRFDGLNDKIEEINPPETSGRILDPEEFGDSWEEPLEKADMEMIKDYFQQIHHLEDVFDFVIVKAGGKDVVVDLAKKGFNRGITFHAPRHSLMTAVQYEIFDDMLIGNFMKTTLHGEFPVPDFRQEFTPWVAKYADNGRAKTPQEVKTYFNEYRKRNPVHFLQTGLQKRVEDTLRWYVPRDSMAFRVGKQAFKTVKKLISVR